jgi:hypothetical protein
VIKFVFAVLLFAAVGAGLLFVAGEVTGGIILVAAAETIAILAIARTSTRA